MTHITCVIMEAAIIGGMVGCYFLTNLLKALQAGLAKNPTQRAWTRQFSRTIERYSEITNVTRDILCPYIVPHQPDDQIDIMEGFYPRGGDNRPNETSIYMTYHWANECGKDLYDGENEMFPSLHARGPPIDWTQPHTFTVEWNATAISWFVDGVQHHQRVAGRPASLFIPQHPFYMILNTAIQPWAAANDTGFPAEHAVDRVTFCKPEPGAAGW